MDLAELKAGVADVAVAYKGRSFTIGYRPEMINEDDLAMFESWGSLSGVDILRGTVAPLARLLVRWSLTNGPTPLEISAENVQAIPPKMRMEMLQAIMADFLAPGNVTPSDAGSQDPASSEVSAPSTPTSSGTPNGLASLPGILPASPTLAAPSSGDAGSPT